MRLTEGEILEVMVNQGKQCILLQRQCAALQDENERLSRELEELKAKEQVIRADA